MSFSGYVRSRWTQLLVTCASAAGGWGLLRLMGLAVSEATLVLVLALVTGGCVLLLGWFRERPLLQGLASVAASEDDALSLAAELRQPNYPEGEMVWEAVGELVKQANGRVGELRVREADYRDYVETWVHEIKTPLAAADLMLENLEGVNTNPLRRELDQVNDYVEQALYYARSTAVDRDFSVRTADLSEMVRDAVKSRAAQLIGSGVMPDLEPLEQGPREVLCDPKWVTFILGQLIDNAVRYHADASQRQPRIRFSTREASRSEASQESWVLLDVRDNGIGIPQSDIGHVFEKGFTGVNGRTHKKSTGIGLYLVKTLCEKMGLGVVATSVEGEWSCFTLAFPSEEVSIIEAEAGPRE